MLWPWWFSIVLSKSFYHFLPNKFVTLMYKGAVFVHVQPQNTSTKQMFLANIVFKYPHHPSGTTIGANLWGHTPAQLHKQTCTQLTSPKVALARLKLNINIHILNFKIKNVVFMSLMTSSVSTCNSERLSLSQWSNPKPAILFDPGNTHRGLCTTPWAQNGSHPSKKPRVQRVQRRWGGWNRGGFF